MRITTFLLTAVLAINLHAAEIDRAAAALSGNEARFTQRFTPKGFKTSQNESGTVLFGTLPKMRWSYTTPEQKLFVFDGSKSWFYVAGDRQVTVAAIDESRRNELPFLLIGDPAARERHFVVTEANSGGSIVTTLQPRDKNAMVRNIAVTIAPATHLIERVEYTDREGNRTTFELTGYQKKSPTADSFRFTPPPGVQVVQAQ